MEFRKIKLAFTVTIVLMVSALIPIVQILVLLLNGGFISLFGDKLNPEIWVNVILGFLGLIAFFKSNKKIKSTILAIVCIIFLLPLFIYLFENRVSDSPYFLQMLLASFMTGLILIFVESLKPN